MGDPTGCVVWCGSFQDMLDYIGSNVSEHFVKAGRPEWPHLDVGNPSRCKPGKAVMETAHESSVRRLANDWRCVLMDRLSWETQGWEVSCGRRCQRELDWGHKRIITLMISGRNRRRPMDIVVFERVEQSCCGGISHFDLKMISRW